MGSSHEVWLKLGEQLDRRPNDVYHHWRLDIQLNLTKLRQDADWEAISRYDINDITIAV